MTSHLAPYESGAQLLKLPETTFEQRCMNTPGVTVEQAKSFRSKLWQMHIDSQHAAEPAVPTSALEDTGPDTILGHLNLASQVSSRDPDQDLLSVPFKDRLRPGMVVKCNLKRWVPMLGESGMVVILCPASAVGSHVKDFEGKSVSLGGSTDRKAEGATEEQFLCAIINPGIMQGAYEISLWRQTCVSIAEMDAEVILEYDAATRYYYIAV